MTIDHDFKYDVFISYARKDGADRAEALADALRAKDFRVYYDLYQNEPGIDWWQRIEDAITSAKSLVFIITAGSVASDICKREWETAQKLNRPLLPVKVVDSGGSIIADSDIPAHINRIHYIDTVKDWNTGIDDIAHFLTRYDYLYELQADLTQLVSESTARRFIEIIATENAEAKKNLKRRMRVRTLKRQPTQATDFNSFDEAWGHYKGQVLLLGAPGAGKTTTLLHYAQTLVSRYLGDRNQPVPVFASIAFWDSYANTPLHEWLPEHNELPDDIRDVIQSGRAVLILDGLDELGREKPVNPKKPEEGTFDPRKRFLEQVQTAIDDGNQILITCRVTDYEDIGEKLNIKGAIELQNLTDDQIDTYLGDVPTIQKTVMADSDLLEICRSPLLLSLIAFGYRDTTDDLKALPSMAEGDLRDAIFEQYITTSYDFEASRREAMGEEMPFTLEKVMDVLGHAAMVNVCGGHRDDYSPNDDDDWGFGSEIVENVLVRHDFTHQLEDNEIENFLKFMEHMNVIENHEADNYRFLHLLIRDYLAFQFSYKNIRNISLYEDIILGPFGDSIVELISSAHSPARTLHNLADSRAVEIICNSYDYFSQNPHLQLYIVASLSGFRENQVINLLINALGNNSDVSVREAAADVLGEIGNEQVIPILIEALGDSESSHHSRTVDRSAAYALEKIGTPEAQQAVKEWRESQE